MKVEVTLKVSMTGQKFMLLVRKENFSSLLTSGLKFNGLEKYVDQSLNTVSLIPLQISFFKVIQETSSGRVSLDKKPEGIFVAQLKR